jgi:dolichol-phosphate mannosyltransferase
MTQSETAPVGAATDDSTAAPRLSVVVPVKDEQDNIRPLIEEIVAAVTDLVPFEIIYVNDGSGDGTLAKLREMKAEVPQLRIITHQIACGQSIAVHTGVKNARGTLIATLDGDGQNNPADIPALLARYEQEGENAQFMVAGQRQKRIDSQVKLFSSRIANRVRGGLLGDQTPDTGCGLKLFRREDFLNFPRFNHMHRFLPALMIRDGGRVVSVKVSHRARERGASKYGVMNRLWVGIVDIFGVMWLQARAKVPVITGEE